MSESTAFPDFIRRIRAGDDQAARELSGGSVSTGNQRARAARRYLRAGAS